MEIPKVVRVAMMEQVLHVGNVLQVVVPLMPNVVEERFVVKEPVLEVTNVVIAVVHVQQL